MNSSKDKIWIWFQHFFNMTYCVLTLPIWLTQGIIFKRIAIRLPEAKGISPANTINGEVLHEFIMLGDSVAAGVGVDHIDNALAGAIAKKINISSNGSWEVLGQSGLKLIELVQLLGKYSISADHYVISIGVNDAKGFTPFKKWVENLQRLFELLTKLSPHAKIIILAVPDMAQFPLLKLPLAKVLGNRCTTLNNLTKAVTAEFVNVTFLPLEFTPKDNSFASDGFHPSSAACQEIANNIIKHIN